MIRAALRGCTTHRRDRAPHGEVVGIDGCKAGWVGVVLREGIFSRAVVAANFRDLLTAVPAASVVAVDIPIGLPTTARRADIEARRVVGARSASVFQPRRGQSSRRQPTKTPTDELVPCSAEGSASRPSRWPRRSWRWSAAGPTPVPGSTRSTPRSPSRRSLARRCVPGSTAGPARRTGGRSWWPPASSSQQTLGARGWSLRPTTCSTPPLRRGAPSASQPAVADRSLILRNGTQGVVPWPSGTNPLRSLARRGRASRTEDENS
jgi:hypothetical protein